MKTSPIEKHIVCFSPINWDEVWEGPQEIMSLFAAAGWQVLFVENIGGRVPRLDRNDLRRIAGRVRRLLSPAPLAVPPPAGITLHTPANLPPYRTPLIAGLNRRLLVRQLRARLDAMGWRRPVVWTYNPSRLVQEVCSELDPALTIYCCVNDYRTLSRHHLRIVQEEGVMLCAADLVFVVSRQLLARRRSQPESVHPLPQGASLGHYLACNAPSVPPDIAGLPHPLIGYIGTIHEWVDQDLIIAAARARPKWSFVLVGPERVSAARLRQYSNIHLLGFRTHSMLPGYVAAFDAGIVPYLTSRGGESLRPNKVLEYLVMGKPVVTTSLPELGEFAEVILSASSAGKFVQALDLALTSDSAPRQRHRRDVAVANSLQNKFPELQALVLARLSESPASAETAVAR